MKYELHKSVHVGSIIQIVPSSLQISFTQVTSDNNPIVTHKNIKLKELQTRKNRNNTRKEKERRRTKVMKELLEMNN